MFIDKVYVLGSVLNDDCEVLDLNSPSPQFMAIEKRPQRQKNPFVCIGKGAAYLLGSGNGEDEDESFFRFRLVDNGRG